MTLAGQRILGWKVMSLLGEGGMAEVWLCEDDVGTKAVAKLLRPEMQRRAAVARRFELEAQVLFKVQHPNVVPLLSFSKDNGLDGRSVYFMAHIQGQPLDGLLARSGPIEPARARRWCDALGDALVTLHAAGIAHRDLKPANILVSDEDVPILIDFGIAHVADRELIETTLTVDPSRAPATFEYLPPREKGVEPDPFDRDVYALGLTAYQMVVGRRPTSDPPAPAAAGSVEAMMEYRLDLSEARTDAGPIDPGPACDKAFRRAIMVGTAPRRAERPDSMAAWVAVLGGQEVPLAPSLPDAVLPSATAPAWRVGLLASALGALVVGSLAVVSMPPSSSPPTGTIEVLPASPVPVSAREEEPRDDGSEAPPLSRPPTLPYVPVDEVRARGDRTPPWPDGLSDGAPVTCMARVEVDATGRTLDVQVSRCPKAFHLPTRQTINRWRWGPHKVDGDRVPYRTEVEVVFEP